MQDQSSHNQVQTAVHDSNERFKLLFSAAPEAMFISDSRGACTDANLAAVKLLGFKKKELIGKTLDDLIDKTELPKLAETRKQTVTTNSYRGEWLFCRKDGSPLYGEILASRLPDGEWVAFVRDIDERKRAEDGLLASEERFRTLIEKSHDAIALIDSSGMFEYLSPGVTDILGFKPAELVGSNCFDLAEPSEVQELASIFAKIMKKDGATITREHRYKNKAGEYVWLETTVTNLLNDVNINAVVSNFSNITERKNSEAETLFQSELLKTVTDTTTLGFFMINEKDICTYINHVAEMMTGYTIDELKGRPLHEYMHHTRPDGQPYPFKDCPIRRAMSHNERVQGEEVFIDKDGNFFPVRFTASPILKAGKLSGTIIEMQDISDELAAQQALIESKERFRQLADSMPQIVWAATPDGHYKYLNKRWYEYSGFKKGDGHEFKEILHPDDIKPFRNSWKHSLKTGEPLQVEYRFRDHRDDSYRWFLGRALPIRDDEGTILRWYGTWTDIDDIKRTFKLNVELEEQAMRLAAQADALIAVNKAKDDFISLASHQLRTPATAVKAYTGMLLEGYAGELAKTQMKFLKQAHESNERQLQTIDDLLNVAQIDTGQFVLTKQPTDIVTLMHDVIDEQSDKFKSRRQNISFESSEIKCVATVDSSRLRMVFENLVDNASKYTPTNKSINVKIDCEEADKIRIIISDQGVGIDEADISRLFQKFSRINNLLSEAVGGTGLGLYWAKKIVDMHGGSIEVSSKKGKGSKFTITLPR